MRARIARHHQPAVAAGRVKPQLAQGPGWVVAQIDVVGEARQRIRCRRIRPDWIGRAVDALSEDVYITIDLDGLDPGTMPAVGTPEPGGLSWRELTALLRATFERRRVVACDVVELCPIPGMASPNFVAAKLVYKLLTYQFGLTRR